MTPLERATMEELLDELDKRCSCMAFAAYYAREGDTDGQLTFGIKMVGYHHERVGLASMLTMRAGHEMDEAVNPPHEDDAEGDEL